MGVVVNGDLNGMKYLSKSVLFICALVFLGGCAGFYSRSPVPGMDNKYFLDRFPGNQKGVVVYRTDLRQERGPDYVYSVWRSDTASSFLWGKEDIDGYIVLPVIPGQYTLDRLAGHTSYMSIKSVVNIDDDKISINTASFEIKSGEVIYLGDFKIKLNSSVSSKDSFLEAFRKMNSYIISFENEDSFQNVKSFMDKTYPNLSPLLVNKPIKLSAVN